jgi:hypothetical protein
MRTKVVAAVAALGLLATACGAEPVAGGDPEPPPPSTVTTEAPTPTVPATTTTSLAPTPTFSPFARPDWLGTRVLPRQADLQGQVLPTPPELENRRLETLDLLPPPAGEQFVSTIGPVPAEVVARSTWRPECPVALDELAYITMSHWGFDERFHTGEMIVNATWAEEIVEVFRKLHEARFPIEQMRVIRLEEIDAPPTGDGNDTTSFVCRPAVDSGNWSRHAYGLAIDINPFHNPYFKDDLVLPELASFYAVRDARYPGVITADDVVVTAFAEIGWPWGGNWRSLKDYMHFSADGN